MDIDKELEELYKKYKRSTKTAYNRNYSLFVYLLATTTAYDQNEQNFKYRHWLPRHTPLERYLACCKALLEYQYDYEYILVDLKLKLLEQDQSYFIKLAAPEQKKEVLTKLSNLFKECVITYAILPEEEWSGLENRITFLNKNSLLKSEYLIHDDDDEYYFSRDEHEGSFLFSTMPEQIDPKKSNTDPRITNILNRFFSADNYCEQNHSLSNEGFGKIQRIDEVNQVETSMSINKFLSGNYKLLDKWTIGVLKNMTYLFLYYTLILDVHVQFETGLKYQPKFWHASGPSEAVDKYADMFLGDKYNVYTTTDLLKKLHAMVLDYDHKRFKWTSLRTAVNRKSYNL